MCVSGHCCPRFAPAATPPHLHLQGLYSRSQEGDGTGLTCQPVTVPAWENPERFQCEHAPSVPAAEHSSTPNRLKAHLLDRSPFPFLLLDSLQAPSVRPRPWAPSPAVGTGAKEFCVSYQGHSPNLQVIALFLLGMWEAAGWRGRLPLWGLHGGLKAFCFSHGSST